MSSEKKFEIFRLFFSILIALLVSFALIFMVSKQPVEAIVALVTGPFRSGRNLANVLESMIPLIFTGTGVCIMFAANQVNLASEGAFHLGGLVAASFALMLGMPPVISPLICLILAACAGAFLTAIPAILKIKTGASEMVASLMLNYLALWFATFILMHAILDPAAGAASYALPKASELLTLFGGTRVHFGLVIAILIAVFGHIFLYRTKMGYQLRIAGSNRKFAEYSGIDIVKVIMISQLLGGAIAGLGGGVEILSPIYSRFNWTSLLGYGWDAIVICTLAKKDPLKTPLAALFLAYLRTGASIMARSTDVTLEVVQITQGVIILLAVAEQFLSKTKHKIIAREAKAALAKEEVG